MAIPQSIQREHILKAIAQIRETGTIPAHRKSRKFDLSYKGRRFPPHYVLSKANKFVPPNAKLHGYRGGERTNEVLRRLGFTIVNKDGKIVSAKTPRQDPPAKGSGSKRKPKKPIIKNLPDPRQLDFIVRTTENVRKARKREAELVKGYGQWLQKKLKFANYQGLRCDAYEEERKNLIEAKSSGEREYLRMAVGQLLDYAYLGRKKLGSPNMAILLPKKPDAKLLEWLSELKISVIWKQGRAFGDNADGQFI